MKQKQKTVIIIVGPTASGKTELAIQLAEKLNTSIISADSRQCFKELNIGVAKPTQEQLERVKHYFINSHSISETVTAQTFEQYALAATETIFEKNDYAVMAGGTGLYIKAFCGGFDEIPLVPEEIRNNVINGYKSKGLQWLQDEIKNNDEAFWKIAEQKNPQRLMRALEVFYSTGKSITVYRKNKTAKRNFNVIKIGLNIPKEELHNNIEVRTKKMIEGGLIKEAETIMKFRNCNALQTVGYAEVFMYLDKLIEYRAIKKLINIHTKQYAKRQLTWFRRDEKIFWMNENNCTQAELIIDTQKKG